jgi:hypothetical protein
MSLRFLPWYWLLVGRHSYVLDLEYGILSFECGVDLEHWTQSEVTTGVKGLMVGSARRNVLRVMYRHRIYWISGS